MRQFSPLQNIVIKGDMKLVTLGSIEIDEDTKSWKYNPRPNVFKSNFEASLFSDLEKVHVLNHTRRQTFF